MLYSFFLDVVCLVFFFKQKTAYEMRISDWSSDVCSSDLQTASAARGEAQFKKCAACHTITPGGANGIGPNIHGIFGKPHGHLPTFPYPDAMKRSEECRVGKECVSTGRFWLSPYH